jgi:hypothetical protein
MVDEFERADAIYLEAFRIGFRNLMELMPGKALTRFEVCGVAEGIFIPSLFPQGNVGLHHSSEDTFTKVFLLYSHAPDVHHHALLAQDRLDLRACLGNHVLLQTYYWRHKVQALHIDVIEVLRSVWQIFGYADSN